MKMYILKVEFIGNDNLFGYEEIIEYLITETENPNHILKCMLTENSNMIKKIKSDSDKGIMNTMIRQSYLHYSRDRPNSTLENFIEDKLEDISGNVLKNFVHRDPSKIKIYINPFSPEKIYKLEYRES